jgi:peptidoglycan hydrolase CwlO-like protein
MENKSCNCAEKIKDLKKEIDRLAEENSNILTISSDHKKINGELQVKLTEAQNKIKDFEENYIKIDGKK